jgi:predicted metal-dependent phosphoesterase TrpH
MRDFPNSVYKKLDLHVHTPASACYSEMNIKPAEIVDAAVAARLNAIGITDHNSAEAIDGIRKIAREKGLVIFPGFEISTRGGHVLAIFDLDTPFCKLKNLLNYVGVKRAGCGDATVQANDTTEEVLQKVVEVGGIANIRSWGNW